MGNYIRFTHLPFVSRKKVDALLDEITQSSINRMLEIFTVTDTMKEIVAHPDLTDRIEAILEDNGVDPANFDKMLELYDLLRKRYFVPAEVLHQLRESFTIDRIVNNEVEDIDKGLERLIREYKQG